MFGLNPHLPIMFFCLFLAPKILYHGKHFVGLIQLWEHSKFSQNVPLIGIYTFIDWEVTLG